MSAVPAEILNKIYARLKKRDIRQASAVCKSWNTVAAYFLGSSLCISVDDTDFEQLRDDIYNYPSFANKVNSLIITSADTEFEPEEALYDILGECLNLRELTFTKPKVNNYLEMIMNSKSTLLPSIQKIEISDLMSCPPSVKTLVTRINFKFINTITSLQFADFEHNRTLKKYGGMINYTSRFPFVTTLNINGYQRDGRLCIDLDRLLAQNHNIENLTIKNVEFETSVDGYTLFIDDYPSLKRLFLRNFGADVAFLDYIMFRFKNLETLSLAGGDIAQNWTSLYYIPTETLERFNSISTIRTFYYAYKSEEILFTNGKVSARFKEGLWGS